MSKRSCPHAAKENSGGKSLKKCQKKRIKTQKKHFHIFKHCQNHPNVQKNPQSCQTKKKVIKTLKSAQKRNKEVKKRQFHINQNCPNVKKNSRSCQTKKVVIKALKSAQKRNKKWKKGNFVLKKNAQNCPNCHVPSRSVTFRHVPNILALSAKSRDFTIQEWTNCFLTSPPLTVQSRWPHLILSPTTKQIRPHLTRHFLRNPRTTQISPYDLIILVADTSTPAAYVSATTFN